MNALPIDHRASPNEVIDKLLADFGVRRVVLTIAARVLRRSYVTTLETRQRRAHQPGLTTLSVHLRKDLGLPPDAPPKALVDLSALGRRDLF